MTQEDQAQKCNNSSSGTCGGGGNFVRPSKKQKPKKVPQRGLGVAQLERIRLEEQQRKDGGSTSTASPTPTKSSSLSVPTPSYHPSNQSCSSSAVPLAVDVPSPNMVFRPSSSLQKFETLNSDTVSLTNAVGWSTFSVQAHENVHKLWNSCDYNIEKESPGVDPGSAFRSSLNNLSHESIPIWPLPSLMERAQQFQHPSSSPVVNESSATSSSSVLNFQMEPPSNQSYCGNYTPMWLEEEKMVGLKRSYPFSLDKPPGLSSFHRKSPPLVHPRISRSDDSASCGSGHTHNFEPGNTISREGSACSTFMLDPNNSKQKIKENVVFNRGFLTLAPSTTNSTSKGSKFRHPQPYLAFHSCDFPDFESLPYQGSVEDPILQPEPGRLNQQPYYSFFPQEIAQPDQATGRMNNYNNGEVGESIDLNLKL